MPAKIEKLNEFQKEFVKWAINRKRCLNVALPGAGKTLALMSLFLLLRKREQASKMLVFTQSKQMKAFDKANIAHLSITRIDTSNALMQFYSMSEFYSDIYLVNPNLLNRLRSMPVNAKQHFFKLVRCCDILSYDEAHELRNYKSTLTQNVRAVFDYYQKLVDSDPVRYRIVLLTATPVYRALENWHAMFALIQPKLFGTYFNFLDHYCIQETRNAYVGQRVYSSNGTAHAKKSISFQEIIGYKNVDDLKAKIEPYVFNWNKKEFEFTYTLVTYSLNEEEQQRYEIALKGSGLDKDYRITLDNRKGKIYHLYRDKTDIFYRGNNSTVMVKDLQLGNVVNFNGEPCVVAQCVDKKKDATHAVRMVKLQQTVSTAQEKLSKLLAIVKKCENGALIYCHYHSSVKTVYEKLVGACLGKRVVVLTGETKDLSTIVASLRGDEIVIGTDTIKQSLDFYSDTIILFEPMSQVGAIEQLVGRLTRNNSPFRDISFYFFMRLYSIEEYLYNKLRLGLKDGSNNPYTKDFPVSPSLEGIDPATINLAYLKERFLWNK